MATTNGGDLMKLPKETLASQLATVKNARKRDRLANMKVKEKGIGMVSGMVGGAMAAAAKKYLPEIVPGDAGDDAAVWLAAGVVDVIAIVVPGELGTQLSYAAAGFGGYLAGSATEEVLP